MRWSSSTFTLLALVFQAVVVVSTSNILPDIAAISPSILFGRQNEAAKCAKGSRACPNIKSSLTYCCPTDQDCFGVEKNTAAVCCPKGSNCGRMPSVECTQVDFTKAEQCGTKCCNLGYSCIAGSNFCRVKKENVDSGAVPADWREILIDEGNGTTSNTLFNCQPLVEKALAEANKFPAVAIIVGFFPGIAVGVIFTFAGMWLWRARQRRQQEKVLATQVYGAGARGGRRKRDTIFDDSLTYNPEREKDLFAIPRGFSLKRKGEAESRIEMYENTAYAQSQPVVPNIPEQYKNPFEEGAIGGSRAPSAVPSTAYVGIHPASAVVEHPPSSSNPKPIAQSQSNNTYQQSSRTSTDSYETYTSSGTTDHLPSSTDKSRSNHPKSKPQPHHFTNLDSTAMPRSFILPPVKPPYHSRADSDANSIISDHDDFESYPTPATRMRSNSSGMRSAAGGGGGGGGVGAGGRARANSRPGTAGGYSGGGRMYDVEEDDEEFGAVPDGKHRTKDGKGHYAFMSPTIPPGLFKRGGEDGRPYP